MNELSQVLSRFESIGLQQMDDVKLMDRTDTKFVFKSEQLPVFLEQVHGDYRVLEVANTRMSRYETLYFDTSDFQLYLKHQNGNLNRYKVRFRKYIDSGLNFFEIKFKSNKGRTIKERIRRDDFRIEGEAQILVNEKTSLDPRLLMPKLWVNCSRITLVNKSSKERLTIDTDLSFKNDVADKHLNNLAIAEVKREKSSPSPFLKLMKQHHIRESPFSKYCLGVMSLYEQVKKNNFKPRLLKLKKLML